MDPPVILLTGLLLAPAVMPMRVEARPGSPPAVRFATFNASLNRSAAGLAQSDLSQPFGPLNSDPLFRLVGVFDFALLPIAGFPTSDHRLVWVDLRLPSTSRAR